jgi:hypothetical protein
MSDRVNDFRKEIRAAARTLHPRVLSRGLDDECAAATNQRLDRRGQRQLANAVSGPMVVQPHDVVKVVRALRDLFRSDGAIETLRGVRVTNEHLRSAVKYCVAYAYEIRADGAASFVGNVREISVHAAGPTWDSCLFNLVDACIHAVGHLIASNGTPPSASERSGTQARDKRITVRLSPEEYSLIKEHADLFADGDISAFVRTLAVSLCMPVEETPRNHGIDRSESSSKPRP